MQGKPVETADVRALFRVLSEHGCSSMFPAPTAIRAIRQQDTHSAIGAQYPLTRYPHHPIPTYWHNTAEMDHSTTVGASSVLYLFCPLEVGLPFIPFNVQGLGTFHPYPVLSPTGWRVWRCLPTLLLVSVHLLEQCPCQAQAHHSQPVFPFRPDWGLIRMDKTPAGHSFLLHNTVLLLNTQGITECCREPQAIPSLMVPGSRDWSDCYPHGKCHHLYW